MLTEPRLLDMHKMFAAYHRQNSRSWLEDGWEESSIGKTSSAVLVYRVFAAQYWGIKNQISCEVKNVSTERKASSFQNVFIDKKGYKMESIV